MSVGTKQSTLHGACGVAWCRAMRESWPKMTSKLPYQRAGGVDVNAVVEQHLHRLELALPRSQQERGCARVGRGVVGSSAPRKQEPEDVKMALRRGVCERARATAGDASD